LEESLKGKNENWDENEIYDVIQTEKNKMYLKLHGWVSENIPGVFSKTLDCNMLPTCEFITCEKKEFYDPLTAFCRDYRAAIVGKNHYMRHINSDEGISFFKHQEQKRLLTLAGQTSGIKVKKGMRLDSLGWRNTDGLATVISEAISQISEFVVLFLAEEYLQRLIKIRDNIAVIYNDDKAIEDSIEEQILKIRAVELEYRKLELDMPYFADEALAKFEKNMNDSCPIKRAIAQLVCLSMSRIKNIDKGIKASIQNSSRLINALSNDKLAKTNTTLQKQMKWLTIASLIVAAVSAVISVGSLKDDKPTTNKKPIIQQQQEQTKIQ
jgi:hypothetical protein